MGVKNEFSKKIADKLIEINLSDLELNVGQLEGLPANPREIKDKKFKLLKKDIQDYPELLEYRSMLVYPLDNGKYIIIDGNMRYRAMSELKYKTAPCLILPKETPKERLKAYIGISGSNFGQWNWDMLADEWEIAELEDWGVDVPFVGEEINTDEFSDDFSLPDGDKKKFQQMAFILADKQAELLKGAISSLQKSSDFDKIENYGNKNKNGNAIFEIVRQWAEQKK